MRRWWILARAFGGRFVGTGNRDKGIKDKGPRDQRQGIRTKTMCSVGLGWRKNGLTDLWEWGRLAALLKIH
jgi:hypothetical protein